MQGGMSYISGMARDDALGFAERYGPWALVVGASEGIGAEFARAVGRLGINVAIVARRSARSRKSRRRFAPRPVSTCEPSWSISPRNAPRRRSRMPSPTSVSGWFVTQRAVTRTTSRSCRSRSTTPVALVGTELRVAVASLSPLRARRCGRVGVVGSCSSRRARIGRRPQHGGVLGHEGVRHGDGRSPLGRVARRRRGRARSRPRSDRHARPCAARSFGVANSPISRPRFRGPQPPSRSLPRRSPTSPTGRSASRRRTSAKAPSISGRCRGTTPSACCSRSGPASWDPTTTCPNRRDLTRLE